MEPKKTIEKISSHLKNPTNAAFLESLEQSEKLENIHNSSKEIVEAVKNIPKPKIPEFPTEMKVKIEGIDVLTLKGDKGEPGEDGHTPTGDELLELITPLIPEPVKGDDGYTPIKGVDYFDGKDADEQEIIKAVLAKIPKPENGKDGKDAEPVKVEIVVKETIRHLQSLKPEQKPSLRMFKEGDEIIGKVALHSSMMSKMPKSLVDGDQRWHGGGITSSTFLPNQVLTGSGTSWQLPSKAAAVIAITGQGQWLSPNSRGTPATPDYVLGADLQTITTTNPWNAKDLEATYIAFGN